MPDAVFSDPATSTDRIARRIAQPMSISGGPRPAAGPQTPGSGQRGLQPDVARQKWSIGCAMRLAMRSVLAASPEKTASGMKSGHTKLAADTGTMSAAGVDPKSIGLVVALAILRPPVWRHGAGRLTRFVPFNRILVQRRCVLHDPFGRNRCQAHSPPRAGNLVRRNAEDQDPRLRRPVGEPGCTPGRRDTQRSATSNGEDVSRSSGTFGRAGRQRAGRHGGGVHSTSASRRVASSTSTRLVAVGAPEAQAADRRAAQEGRRGTRAGHEGPDGDQRLPADDAALAGGPVRRLRAVRGGWASVASCSTTSVDGSARSAARCRWKAA